MDLTVVVPVHNMLRAARVCLESLHEATHEGETRTRVIVIDDASSSPTANFLSTFCEEQSFELIRNTTNLGFTSSVNSAMRLENKNHILLLNSDAFVFPDTLDRLMETARQHASFASITPLTNNGTIAEFPHSIDDLVLPPFQSRAIDDACRRLNLSPIEAPTGIGFCMLMSRAAIDEVGLFDEEGFSRGYGEENDWCQRARRAGFTSFISPACFVEHSGSLSFSVAERNDLLKVGLEEVQRAHPSYLLQVDSFLHERPLAKAFAELAIDLLAHAAMDAGEQLFTLHIVHNLGGGTESVVQAQLRDGQKGDAVARPTADSGFVLEFPPFGAKIPCSLTWGADWVADALRKLRIGAVSIHNLVGWDASSARQVFIRAARSANADVEVVLHDYQWVCPQVNLVDVTDSYCGVPNLSVCDTCCQPQNRLGVESASRWRAESHELADLVTRFVAPSTDARVRHGHLLPEARIVERHHDNIDPFAGEFDSATAVSEPAFRRRRRRGVNILCIGAIGIAKGAEVLQRLDMAPEFSELGCRLTVLGEVALPLSEGTAVLGRYSDEDVLFRVGLIDPDVIFLPFVWPETYSFVTSIAIASKRPVAAFDIGAPAERLLRAEGGPIMLIPLEVASDASELAVRLYQFGMNPH